MTREELDIIKRENEKIDVPDESPVACVFHLNDLAITKVRCSQLIDAVEAAWSDTEAWVQWVYRIGLQLDWFTPAIGIDNRERIEKAVKALKASVKERDAYKFAAEQAIGMGTAKAIMDERDQLKHRVRELEARIEELEQQNRALTIERDNAVRLLNEVVDRHTTQDLGTPRSGIE